jgi:hypothetical protein
LISAGERASTSQVCARSLERIRPSRFVHALQTVESEVGSMCLGANVEAVLVDRRRMTARPAPVLPGGKTIVVPAKTVISVQPARWAETLAPVLMPAR